MSFTVDFILTELPKEETEAWSFIERLREEYYEDNSGAHEKLVQLHSVLTQKYPCLCSYADDDPELDKCPWSDGPMINNFASKMGMVAIAYSRADELFPFILEKALELDIIVADGQSEKIYRPGEPVNNSEKPWWKVW